MASTYFSDRDEETLMIIPRVTGSISFLCSLLIIFIILAEARVKLKHVYQRLLLGLSLTDIMCSLNITQNGWVTNYSAACSINGFLFNFGSCTVIYNACLCIHFLLVICYKWTPRRFKESRVELLMHTIALGWPLSIGAVGLATQSYEEIALIPGYCHYSEYPKGRCSSCPRRPFVFWLDLLTSLVPPVVCTLIILYCMIRIFWTVRQQERRQAAYEFRNESSQKRKSFQRTKQAAKQAALYIAAYLVTYVPAVVAFLVVALGGKQHQHGGTTYLFAWSVLVVCLWPLQGFWNLIGMYVFRTATKFHIQCYT